MKGIESNSYADDTNSASERSVKYLLQNKHNFDIHFICYVSENNLRWRQYFSPKQIVQVEGYPHPLEVFL
jgi:DNA-dependent RNA polymerase auxiliary subunit epsilon